MGKNLFSKKFAGVLGLSRPDVHQLRNIFVLLPIGPVLTSLFFLGTGKKSAYYVHQCLQLLCVQGRGIILNPSLRIGGDRSFVLDSETELEELRSMWPDVMTALRQHPEDSLRRIRTMQLAGRKRSISILEELLYLDIIIGDLSAAERRLENIREASRYTDNILDQERLIRIWTIEELLERGREPANDLLHVWAMESRQRLGLPA